MRASGDSGWSSSRAIADLRRLLPSPAERDLPAGRRRALKEHLMSELRHADPARRSTRPTGARRRPAALAATAAAGALAVAVAVSLAATSGPTGGRPSAGHGGTRVPGGPVQSVAAQLLSRIAAAAARQPTPAVRDSQYTYIASYVEDPPPMACLLVNGRCRPFHPPGTRRPRPHRRQLWQSVSDLCRPGLLRDPAVGGGGLKITDSGGKCPDRGSMNDPTYRFLQSLPTNPRRLLNLIYKVEKGHGSGSGAEAFTTIGDLLRESVVPPKVSAALYRAAGLIPGVTVVPDAVDILGQHGVAVTFAEPARRTSRARPAAGGGGRPAGSEEWIFDKATLQWIGENDFVNGKLNGGTAILARAIVNRPGQAPPSPPA